MSSKKPVGSEEEIIHFNNLKPSNTARQNLSTYSPGQQLMMLSQSLWTLNIIRTSQKKAAREGKSRYADGEEQNEEQLQRERYPARQRQAPDYFELVIISRKRMFGTLCYLIVLLKGGVV